MFDLGVENAREGTIIEPNKENTAGLASRIEAIVTNQNELERLGKAGQRFIATQFSKDRINRLWEEAVVSAYQNRRQWQQLSPEDKESLLYRPGQIDAEDVEEWELH